MTTRSIVRQTYQQSALSRTHRTFGQLLTMQNSLIHFEQNNEDPEICVDMQKPDKINFIPVLIFSVILLAEIMARVLVSHYMETSFLNPNRKLRESRMLQHALALPPRDSTKFRILVLSSSPLMPNRNDFNSILSKSTGRSDAVIYNLSGIAKSGIQSAFEYQLLRNIYFDEVIFYQGINDFKKDPAFHNTDLLILEHPECFLTTIPLALHYFALHHIPTPLRQYFVPKVAIVESIQKMVEISKAKREPLILPTFAYWPDTLNIPPERMRAQSYNDPKVLQIKLDALNSFIRQLNSPYLVKPDVEKIIPKSEEYFYDVCHFTKRGTELFIRSILIKRN